MVDAPRASVTLAFLLHSLLRSRHRLSVQGIATAAIGAGAGYLLRRAGAAVAAARERFDGMTVVITGGSRGLGFALARVFAAEGATVALLARTPDQLDAAVQRLQEEFGVRALSYVCDVRDAHAVEAAVSEIVRRTGRLDVLVNNAGVIQVMPFAHAQPADFENSLATHFWGPYHLTRACLPHLRRRRGRIVNVASIGGRVAVPHLLPYGVGKFALVGFSEGLQAELAAQGVSVTTVTPHLMQTGSHRNALVRGRHALEATWFALGTATRLTALDADDAARQIVEAARGRRASAVVGWQAQMAILVNAVAPEVTARVAATAARVLPADTDAASGKVGRLSRDVHVGRIARVFPTGAARAFNQVVAPDEA